MSVPLLLLETLDDLTLKDFKRFQWLLENGVLDCCKPVARSRLEDADRPGTVGVMTRDYGEGTAANVAVEILKKMGHNGTAEKLQKRHAAAASTSTSDAPAAPPAAAPVAPPPPAAPVAPPAAAPVAPPPPAAPVAPPPATMIATERGVIIAPSVTCGTIGTFNITFNK